MALSCHNVIDKASEYFDGEMGKLMAFRIRMHIAICPPCKRYFNQMMAVLEATRTLSVSEKSLDDHDHHEECDCGGHDIHGIIDSLMKELKQGERTAPSE